MLLREFLQLVSIIFPDTDYVFVSLTGDVLKRRALEQRITEYGKRAGLKGVRVNPHTFRHTFAKLWVIDYFAFWIPLIHGWIPEVHGNDTGQNNLNLCKDTICSQK